jgi:hypothetical protein
LSNPKGCVNAFVHSIDRLVLEANRNYFLVVMFTVESVFFSRFQRSEGCCIRVSFLLVLYVVRMQRSCDGFQKLLILLDRKYQLLYSRILSVRGILIRQHLCTTFIEGPYSAEILIVA